MTYVTVTNASNSYLDRMAKILEAGGQKLEYTPLTDALHIVRYAGGAKGLESVNTLSHFDFLDLHDTSNKPLSDLAEDPGFIASVERLSKQLGLKPLQEAEAFAAFREDSAETGVTGGKDAYARQYAMTAAHTPRPKDTWNKDILIVGGVEGYNEIFGRGKDGVKKEDGTLLTSYAARYNIAPRLSLKHLDQTISRIAAHKEAGDEVYVLDYGCGHGRFLIPVFDMLAEKGLKPKILAFDPAPNALEALKDNIESRNEIRRLKGLNDGNISYTDFAPGISDAADVIILNRSQDLQNFAGRADLAMSMAGAIHHADNDAILQGSISDIKQTLSGYGLFVGTGPTANLRYREKMLAKFDMQHAGNLFADVSKAVPGLLSDSEFIGKLNPDYVDQLKKQPAHGADITRIAAAYDMDLEEVAVQIAELSAQRRSLGHPVYTEGTSLAPAWHVVAEQADSMFARYKGQEVFVKWTYRLETPQSLASLLGGHGIAAETWKPDCFNHNDAAAADPATVQQELRLAASPDLSRTPLLDTSFDYWFVAHNKAGFLEKKVQTDISACMPHLTTAPDYGDVLTQHLPEFLDRQGFNKPFTDRLHDIFNNKATSFPKWVNDETAQHIAASVASVMGFEEKRALNGSQSIAHMGRALKGEGEYDIYAKTCPIKKHADALEKGEIFLASAARFVSADRPEANHANAAAFHQAQLVIHEILAEYDVYKIRVLEHQRVETPQIPKARAWTWK